MKKLVLSVAAACMLFSSAIAGGNGEATTVKHDEPVAGGFFINVPVGIYGGNFMSSTLVDKADIKDEDKISMIGYGLELGTMFQITQIGDGMGIGIRAMWLNFGLASGSNETTKQTLINVQFLSPGIYFTKALGDNAIDVYANYVPTLAGMGAEDKATGFSASTKLALGTPMEFGLAFRTGVLMAGLEYNFGKVIQGDVEVEGETIESDTDVVNYGRWGHLRVQVGVKF